MKSSIEMAKPHAGADANDVKGNYSYIKNKINLYQYDIAISLVPSPFFNR